MLLRSEPLPPNHAQERRKRSYQKWSKIMEVQTVLEVRQLCLEVDGPEVDPEAGGPEDHLHHCHEVGLGVDLGVDQRDGIRSRVPAREAGADVEVC